MTNIVKPKRVSFGTYLDADLPNKIQLLQIKRNTAALKSGEKGEVSMADIVNDAVKQLLEKEKI